jgi:aminopeptidase N
MKFHTLALSLLISAQVFPQHVCSRAKQTAFRSFASSGQTSHEMKYDVRFVHLNLNVERINKTISGNVRTVAVVTVQPLDTFMTLLHQNMIIDSVRFNGALINVIRQDSIVKSGLSTPLSSGASFTSIVYYHGTPPTGGAAIGSGMSNATSPSWGNQATWSLSESFVAYHWWPCKQALTDKIDSSWVFVTTDSLNKAGSNGILKNVVTIGAKKRYEWKSCSPIDYYLISVAVAKYKEYNLYAKPAYLGGDSILIQNYIYDAAINSTNFNNQKNILNKMPQVLSFLCNQYGMYPFYKEKYGHCMAPLSGGMEHQTMSTVGFFDYYVNAHELGHQWWGDNVTCKTWGDIWINEGFASYTEHLVAQYLDAANFAVNLDDAHNNVMSQPGGSIFFTGADTLNSARIFSSRLTYDKGGAILHTLRFITNNDSLWFGCLRGFQNQYKNKTASTQDFKNYYDTFTGINSTIFFNQWYYGQGYPTFNLRFNTFNNVFHFRSTQSVSAPNATPLFITPVEYKLLRTGKPDTTIKVMHSQAVENYSLVVSGTVTGIVCDPNNWIINQPGTAVKDATLGVTTEALAEMELTPVTIGPNPANDRISIHAPQQSGIVEMFDHTGKLILEKQVDCEVDVDVSMLPTGFYIVRVKTAAHDISVKLVRD